MQTAAAKRGNARGKMRPAPARAVQHGDASLPDSAVTAPAKPPRRSHAQAREEAINQIIDIATQEFVEKGLAGARIDEIMAGLRPSPAPAAGTPAPAGQGDYR